MLISYHLSPRQPTPTLQLHTRAARHATSNNKPHHSMLNHHQTLQYTMMGSGMPIVIVHGLLGSKENWQSIMRSLSETNTTIAPDLPNHGASYHTQEITHANMAQSIDQLLDELGIDQCILLGHSLGGKVAMQYAQLYPQRSIAGMIIVDIAPKRYPHTEHLAILNAMQLCAEQNLPTRSAANTFLTSHISNPLLRAFILKNFTPPSWRCNVQGLRNNLTNLSGWSPTTPKHHITHDTRAPHPIPTLAIIGNRSDYVTNADQQLLSSMFPNIQFTTMPTGHWPHAEAPRDFVNTLLQFIDGLY